MYINICTYKILTISITTHLYSITRCVRMNKRKIVIKNSNWFQIFSIEAIIGGPRVSVTRVVPPLNSSWQATWRECRIFCASFFEDLSNQRNVSKHAPIWEILKSLRRQSGNIPLRFQNNFNVFSVFREFCFLVFKISFFFAKTPHLFMLIWKL